MPEGTLLSIEERMCPLDSELNGDQRAYYAPLCSVTCPQAFQTD